MKPKYLVGCLILAGMGAWFLAGPSKAVRRAHAEHAWADADAFYAAVKANPSRYEVRLVQILEVREKMMEEDGIDLRASHWFETNREGPAMLEALLRDATPAEIRNFHARQNVSRELFGYFTAAKGSHSAIFGDFSDVGAFNAAISAELEKRFPSPAIATKPGQADFFVYRTPAPTQPEELK